MKVVENIRIEIEEQTLSKLKSLAERQKKSLSAIMEDFAMMVNDPAPEDTWALYNYIMTAPELHLPPDMTKEQIIEEAIMSKHAR